jgi:hypothetical protein
LEVHHNIEQGSEDTTQKSHLINETVTCTDHIRLTTCWAAKALSR